MGSIGRKVMWTVMGTAASKAVRRMTRGAMHTSYGAPRLPARARRSSGFAAGLAWVAGAAAAMAIADILREQGRTSAHVR